MGRTVHIACDLFIPLKLYDVPATYLSSLQERFPQLMVHKINVDGARVSSEDLQKIEVYWGNRITPEIIRSLPALKWIQFGSNGVNRAAIPDVYERGIVVTNSRGTMEAAVATTGFAFILSLARGLHHSFWLRTEKNLSRQSFDLYFDEIQNLEGQTCLIVGAGEVGHRLAKMCESAGMTVIGVRKNSKSPSPIFEKMFDLRQLPLAVKEADYVVSLLPLTEETTRVFSREVFANMKTSAFFVNIGRGGCVDEVALVEAVRDRKICGAALDVYDQEPLSLASPLWDLERIIMTPHIAGLSNKYWEKEYALVRENIGRYLKSENLLNVVDMRRGY